MKYPSTRNLKPEPLEVGTDAYCIPAKRIVRIVDELNSSRFESGIGYLAAYDDELDWLDATWFWTEKQVQRLLEDSKK